MQSPSRFRLPVSAVVLGVLGLITLVLGVLALAGQLAHVHPLLNGDGGLALLVSAVALILSGGFPLALSLLATTRGEAE